MVATSAVLSDTLCLAQTRENTDWICSYVQVAQSSAGEICNWVMGHDHFGLWKAENNRDQK